MITKLKGDKIKIPAPIGAAKYERKRSAPERIFTIMAEFFLGYEFFGKLGYDNLTVFGSARFKPGHPMYEEAVKFSKLIGQHNLATITGGGGGIMEAANRGAFLSGAPSIGINVQLPFEQRTNPFVKKAIGFYYFFTRKVVLAKSYKAYVFFPGGFGTLDEFFEMLELVQKTIKHPLPIVCVGRDYWQPVQGFLQNCVKCNYISKKDLSLFKIVDNAEQAYAYLQKKINL